MINTHNNTSPIDIGILEVSSQNRAVLSFFIDSVGADIFKEVDIDQASAFIIDFDFPGAKESWQELQATNKPAIILSIKEVDMPGSIWVQKPLTAKTLTSAGQKLKALISNNATNQPVEEAIALETLSAPQPVDSLDIEKVSEPARTVLETPSDLLPTLENELTDTDGTNTSNKITATDDLDSLLYDLHTEPQSNDELQIDTNANESKEAVALETPSDLLPTLENELTDTDGTNTSNKITATDDLDSLLYDLHTEPQSNDELAVDANANDSNDALVASGFMPELITESAPAIQAETTRGVTKLATPSTDLTDTLTLEKREKSTPLMTDVADPEVSELDSLLSDLKSEHQTDNEIPNIEIDTIKSPVSNEELSTPPHNNSFEQPEITIENHKNQNELSQAKEKIESELYTEPHVVESFPQDTQANEQTTAIDDTNITNDFDSNIPSTTDLETEVIEETVESYAEATDVDLEAMLDELQQEMGNTAGGTPNINSESTDGSTQKTYQGTQAQERWALLCGDKKLVRSASDIKKSAFTLEEHFLSSLLNTLKEGKETKQIKRIKYDDLLIFIDYETDTVYSDLSIHSDEYAQICFEPIKAESIKIHALDNSEVRMLQKTIINEPHNVYSTEAFIWTTSLLTSRGRLVKNTSTSKAIGLKSWPNLTRVESFPHMMNIAAVFSKNPGNLMDVSKWLNIPQCYVFAFYNAAFFLNMIDLDSNVGSKNKSRRLPFNFGSKKKSENSGMFSRLLNKIKG